MHSKEKNATRREAFKILGGLLVSSGGAVGIVHYAVKGDPTADETVELGPVSAFPVGQFQQRIVTVTEHGTWLTGPVQRTVWVRRNPDDTLLVFSGTCPHMNCTVNLAPQGFECPCHHSQFDLEGKVVLPPAPRPLDTLDVRVSSEGMVSVQFQNFRKGIPEKERAT